MNYFLAPLSLIHRHLLVLLGLVFASLWVAASAHGSILIPQDSVFAANSDGLAVDFGGNCLIAEEDTQNGAGASGQDEPPIEERPESDPNEQLVRQLDAIASHSEGSSSGTSSSAGTGVNGSGASLLCDEIRTLPASTPSRLRAYELALILPDPPGTDLLRPPQG